jgi:hypothetical protein
MATKLILKKSSVTEKVPLTTDLEIGELALNLADRKLFSKDANNAIIEFGSVEVSQLTVYNGTGSTVTKGSVVYINGAQGQKPSIALANNTTDATSSKTFGLVVANILNGAEGLVTTAGLIYNLNTGGLTEGGPIYLSSTAGAFTQVKPSAPSHLVSLGWVVKANASSGRVLAHIQNGFELDELHDVDVLTTTPTNNQVLTYELSSGLWKNKDQTPTNLSLGVSSGTVVQLDSSTGTDVVLPTASTTLAGLVTTGTQTFGGDKTFNGNVQLSRALVETIFTVTDGASVDLSPSNGTIQQWTLTASRTPVLPTNWPAGSSMTLMIADGTAFAITWTTMAPVWVGGTAPTLATTGWTVLTFWKVGTVIYGAITGNVA